MNNKKNTIKYIPNDKLLNGDPSITFFKSFYKKYEPFVVEPVYINYNNTVSFGQESSANIKTIGDLINQMAIEVILPAISLNRNVNPISQNNQDYLDSITNLRIVKQFATINREAYIATIKLFEASNIINTNYIVSAINIVFNNSVNIQIINNFKNILPEVNSYSYSEVSLQDIANNLNNNSSLTKTDYYNYCTFGINKLQRIQQLFFDKYYLLKAQVEDDVNPNLKFAWVNNIGHAIIKSVEILINGKTVDKHTSEWLEIKSKLSEKVNKNNLYNKLIGNVPELIEFNRIPKPEYKLLIPLRFWFCNDYSASLPIIGLRSNNITLKISFRKIEEVSYIENNSEIYLGLGKDSISLSDVPEVLGYNITSRVHVDYIHLSDKEKIKFIKNNYEYIIETIDYYTFQTFNNKITFNLATFPGLNKTFYWIAQKVASRLNLLGYNKTEFTNFTVDNIEPINNSSIIYNNFDRVPKLDYNFYNIISPQEIYDSSSSKGINIFTFALSDNLQPSGHTTIGKNIKNTVLNLEFDNSLVNLNTGNLKEKYNIIIFSKKINILRIKNGFFSLTFN